MGSTRIEIWREAPGAVRVASDFIAITRSDRVPSLLQTVASAGGVVIAALGDGELRGYATLVPASALARERWEHLPDTFELGSIEVARSQRRRGIGTELLSSLQGSLPLEQLILFARGFAGHWDVAAAALPWVEYRRALLRMLGRAGFERWDTDDPEVLDHPLNFLAVRVGRDAPSSSMLEMARCALASSPWA